MIIDASAVVDVITPSPRSSALWALLEAADGLAAPQLLSVEVASAMWRAHRAGMISERQADDALRRYQTLDVTLLDHSLLLEHAWRFRHANRVTDCFYLAAAALLGEPLLTTDLRLARSHHGVPVVTVS